MSKMTRRSQYMLASLCLMLFLFTKEYVRDAYVGHSQESYLASKYYTNDPERGVTVQVAKKGQEWQIRIYGTWFMSLPDGNFPWKHNDKWNEIKNITVGNKYGYFENIQANAFSDCPNLDKIDLKDASLLQFIEGSAFRNCSKLSSVTLPKSVVYIGPYAFAECPSLKTVTFNYNSGSEIPGIIPEYSELYIDEGAFYESGLNEFSSFANLGLGMNAFSGLTRFIRINSWNPTWIDNGIQKNWTKVVKNLTNMIQIIPTEGEINNIYTSIYKEITDIEENMKDNAYYKYLKKNVYVDMSVQDVCNITYMTNEDADDDDYDMDDLHEFNEYCTKLSHYRSLNQITDSEYVQLNLNAAERLQSLLDAVNSVPAKIGNIESSAICNCEQLESIEFTGTFKSISPHAISGCSSLKNVSFRYVGSINQSAISNCSALSRIKITTASFIHSEAFIEGLPALSMFLYCGSQWGQNTPAVLDGEAKKIIMPEQLHHVTVSAKTNITNLQNVFRCYVKYDCDDECGFYTWPSLPGYGYYPGPAPIPNPYPKYADCQDSTRVFTELLEPHSRMRMRFHIIHIAYAFTDFYELY